VPSDPGWRSNGPHPLFWVWRRLRIPNARGGIDGLLWVFAATVTMRGSSRWRRKGHSLARGCEAGASRRQAADSFLHSRCWSKRKEGAPKASILPSGHVIPHSIIIVKSIIRRVVMVILAKPVVSTQAISAQHGLILPTSLTLTPPQPRPRPRRAQGSLETCPHPPPRLLLSENAHLRSSHLYTLFLSFYPHISPLCLE
jgi:hypothetical protein